MNQFVESWAWPVVLAGTLAFVTLYDVVVSRWVALRYRAPARGALLLLVALFGIWVMVEVTKQMSAVSHSLAFAIGWMWPLPVLAVMVVMTFYNLLVLQRTEPPRVPWTRPLTYIAFALLLVSWALGRFVVHLR
jgi:hypothetical protein